VGDGDEVPIHIGEAGSWFGEYGLLSEGSPSIGSVVADGPTRIAFLAVAEFERIVTDEPRYYREFARLLVGRFALLFRYMAASQGLAPREWLWRRIEGLAAMRLDDAPSAARSASTCRRLNWRR
jgi:CRP-like cAMP-binding protein